jgi:hypothetical protein
MRYHDGTIPTLTRRPVLDVRPAVAALGIIPFEKYMRQAKHPLPTPTAVVSEFRAFQFEDEEHYDRALELLDHLAVEDGPLEYDLAPDNTAVLPLWSYRKALPVLAASGLTFTDAEVAPLSNLPPRRQAEIRGLIWKKRSLPSR